MAFLDRFRARSADATPVAPGKAGDAPRAEDLPIRGYDDLDVKEIGARLPKLSQVELTALEAYERAHADRPKVLDKLRYMHTTEPVEGYDAMSEEQVVAVLAGADGETIKNVRDYERKFRGRYAVLEEAGRVLPDAAPSAGEEQTRKDRAARMKEGFESRANTPVGFSGGKGASAADAPADDAG
jgi:hypothetical protein